MTTRDVALALSGGGYRAAFFHLGVLRKLHELGLLERIAVISSVSGGSIVAGAYAQSLLNSEDFTTFEDGTRRFLDRGSLDWPALLSELNPLLQSSKSLEKSFGRVFKRPDGGLTRMSDLAALRSPRFVFNATAVHSGRGWRFVSGGVAEEWELGHTHGAAYSRSVDRYRCDVTLAKAVTASAAFPVFSAVTMDRGNLLDASEEATVEPRQFYQDLTDPVCLSDGGVRDNMGLTSIVTGYEPPGYETDYYLIGSDAGAIVDTLRDSPEGLQRFLDPRAWLNAPPRGRIRKVHYLLRQFDIMGHHNNRLTAALILKEHRARAGSDKGMAMLRIDEAVPELAETATAVAELAGIKTRLKSPGWSLAEGLMNHGANLLWARVSEYTNLLPTDRLMPGTQKRRHKDIERPPGAMSRSPYEEARAFLNQVLSILLEKKGNGSTVMEAVREMTADPAAPALSVEAEQVLARLFETLHAARPYFSARRLLEHERKGFSLEAIRNLIMLALRSSPDILSLMFEPLDQVVLMRRVEDALRDSLRSVIGTVIDIDEVHVALEEGRVDENAVFATVRYRLISTEEADALSVRLWQ
jgi:predicted acylesterase/phospholipase RssA